MLSSHFFKNKCLLDDVFRLETNFLLINKNALQFTKTHELNCESKNMEFHEK
jgi:hypothetical protein